MYKLYAWNVGWVMGIDANGCVRYTKYKEGAKPYPSLEDKEFVRIARIIEHEGHHLDKVR